MSELFKPKEVSRIGQENASLPLHNPIVSPEQNKLFVVTRESNRNNIPSGFPQYKAVEPLSSVKKDVSPLGKATTEAKGSIDIKEKKEVKEPGRHEKEPEREEKRDKEEKREKEHKGGGKKPAESHRGAAPSEKEPKVEDRGDHKKDRKEEQLDKKNDKDSPASCAAGGESSLKLVQGIPGLTAPAIGDFYTQTKCGADGKPVVSTFDLNEKITGKQWTEPDGRKISVTYAGAGPEHAKANDSALKSAKPSEIDENESQKGRILTSKNEVFPNGDFDYFTYDKNGKVTGGVTYFDGQIKSK